MSHEELQAGRLAAWLDGGDRSGAPPDLDMDVIEAVLALRPELAAPPALDIDELMLGVTSGPFAPAQPEAAPTAEVIALAPRRSPWAWLAAGGGVATGGVLLAAALALVIVLPRTLTPSSTDELQFTEVPAAEPAPATPRGDAEPEAAERRLEKDAAKPAKPKPTVAAPVSKKTEDVARPTNRQASAAEQAPGEEAEAKPSDSMGLAALAEAARPWDYRSPAASGTTNEATESVDVATAADAGAVQVDEAQRVQALLGAGEDARAAAAARDALPRWSANTPTRSQLLWLLGIALERTGDVAGAETAYIEAAKLNADRGRSTPTMRAPAAKPASSQSR
jgi:hypothetical protein